MLTELQKLLPPEQILTAAEDIIPYTFDGTAALSQRPQAVVHAHSTEQVSAVLGWAQRYGTPIVTRGSGTGLSGGSVPVVGGIVLCLAQCDRMLELDRANLTLLAEAGATTLAIAEAATEAGLFYPPDPGSMKISTIGGNVANNSGGLRGLKYGVTRNYVMGMEVVLADGSVTWLGSKCVKDVAGLSLKDLFVGSEGILGIITKVLLKLVPKPAARETMLAVYDDLEAAARTVSAIIAAPIIPCTLEFLDRTTIACVEDYAKIGLPLDAEAILLAETDGHPAVIADEIARMEAIAKENGAKRVQLAQSEEERLNLAAARRTAFSALARRRPTTILEDVTVPRSELPELVRFIADCAAKHNLQCGTFGHFGDGNVHPTFLTDERDKEEMHRVELALGEIVELTIKLGGTITGEHGVGLAKKGFLPHQFDPGSMNLLRDVKRALDPKGLLNPGKIFDTA